jgi:hypothetical protein
MMKQDKTRPRRWLIALLAAAILGESAALAQTGGGYDLTWSTVDGGGAGPLGVSGGYQLS